MLTFPLRLGESEGALLGLPDNDGESEGIEVGCPDELGESEGCDVGAPEADGLSLGADDGCSGGTRGEETQEKERGESYETMHRTSHHISDVLHII